MARTASAFFGGTAIGSTPVAPRFGHDGKSARGYSFTPVTRNEIGRIVTGDTQPLPFGTEVIVDLGGFCWGPGCYRPYDMSRLVPYGQPIPSLPPDVVGEYVDLIALPVYVRGRGLAQWLIGGVLGQNAMFALWTRFQHASEAAQGQIPVLLLRPSAAIPIASRNGELSWQPILEIAGWVVRDPAVFGIRTVAAPMAQVAAGTAPAGIMQPAALPQPVPMVLPPEQLVAPVQAAAATPSATHYQPPAGTPVATPTPAPVAAAVDPFAGMVPAGVTAPVTVAATEAPHAVARAAEPAAVVAAGSAGDIEPASTITVAAPGAAPPF
jgi:hypothetical protein